MQRLGHEGTPIWIGTVPPTAKHAQSARSSQVLVRQSAPISMSVHRYHARMVAGVPTQSSVVQACLPRKRLQVSPTAITRPFSSLIRTQSLTSVAIWCIVSTRSGGLYVRLCQCLCRRVLPVAERMPAQPVRNTRRTQQQQQPVGVCASESIYVSGVDGVQ